MALQQAVPDVPILRVNQIDAARLDVEMTAMLKEQLSRVFSLSQVRPFLTMLNYFKLTVVYLNQQVACAPRPSQDGSLVICPATCSV